MTEEGVSKDIKRIFHSERSLMKIRNMTGPRTLPWGTPALTGRGVEMVPLSATCWITDFLHSRSQECSWPWMTQTENMENKVRCQTASKARDMTGEMALMSRLILRASIHGWVSRSSMSKVE